MSGRLTVDQLRAGWATLSSAERGIATLLIDGHSNRQIGALTWRSPRTIQAHVEHMLAKLGFTSRTQIAICAWVSQTDDIGVAHTRTGDLYRVTWVTSRRRQHSEPLPYAEALRRFEAVRATPGRYGVRLLTEAQHQAAQDRAVA